MAFLNICVLAVVACAAAWFAANLISNILKWLDE